MKIKIDEDGFLIINGRTRYCPHSSSMECGDWCALFGEPLEVGNNRSALNLCHQIWICPREDFTGERTEGGK